MITSIRLVNFKNFADETLRVGPFTVIVGANASGKSNIRDAFRFLHGIGRGYTLAEIIGGKYGADWKPIRGAANEIVRFGQAAFSIEVCRLEGTSDAIIRPVAELPNVQELRQDQGLGRLHESGWMETALFFTEDCHEPTRTT